MQKNRGTKYWTMTQQKKISKLLLLLERDAIFHLNSRSTFVNEKYCIQNLFTIFIQMKSRQEKGKKLHSFEYELLNNYFFPQFFIIE